MQPLPCEASYVLKWRGLGKLCKATEAGMGNLESHPSAFNINFDSDACRLREILRQVVACFIVAGVGDVGAAVVLWRAGGVVG
jgi:hypothetical protein